MLVRRATRYEFFLHHGATCLRVRISRRIRTTWWLLLHHRMLHCVSVSYNIITPVCRINKSRCIIQRGTPRLYLSRAGLKPVRISRVRTSLREHLRGRTINIKTPFLRPQQPDLQNCSVPNKSQILGRWVHLRRVFAVSIVALDQMFFVRMNHFKFHSFLDEFSEFVLAGRWRW